MRSALTSFTDKLYIDRSYSQYQTRSKGLMISRKAQCESIFLRSLSMVTVSGSIYRSVIQPNMANLLYFIFGFKLYYIGQGRNWGEGKTSAHFSTNLFASSVFLFTSKKCKAYEIFACGAHSKITSLL